MSTSLERLSMSCRLVPAWSGSEPRIGSQKRQSVAGRGILEAGDELPVPRRTPRTAPPTAPRAPSVKARRDLPPLTAASASG